MQTVWLFTFLICLVIYLFVLTGYPIQHQLVSHGDYDSDGGDVPMVVMVVVVTMMIVMMVVVMDVR